MLDRQREHQRSAAAVLRHLARRVGIALHERNDTRGGEGRVQHGAARGTDVREVVPHAAAALHQLHLLLVHAENAAVRVGRVLMADHEAVRERGHLKVVADTRHRAALRNHVPEMVEQLEHLLLAHRIGILALDALDLGGDTLVHLLGRRFVNIAERVVAARSSPSKYFFDSATASLYSTFCGATGFAAFDMTILLYFRILASERTKSGFTKMILLYGKNQRRTPILSTSYLQKV